jgi:hypothetical protein
LRGAFAPFYRFNPVNQENEMLIKLAALGALGYAGYKFLNKKSGQSVGAKSPDIRLAGGPLSSRATVQRIAPAGVGS